MIKTQPIQSIVARPRFILLGWLICIVLGCMPLSSLAGNTVAAFTGKTAIRNKDLSGRMGKDKETGKVKEDIKAKETEKDKERRNIDPVPNYEETAVSLSIRNAGPVEVGAVVSGTIAYLSITDLFDFLKIKNNTDENTGNISGFIVDPSDLFTIDKINNLITYKGKGIYLSNSEMIVSESGIFLCTQCYKDVFGLECTFNFRSLSVNLNTTLDLPLLREIRQEEIRKTIRSIKGELVADTTIRRKNLAFHIGSMDWSIFSTQILNGGNNSNANLAIGGFIAGGETDIRINYNSNQQFTNKNLSYRWRYVNNESKVLKQLLLGKIPSQAISSIFSPLVGVQLTNSPTTYRKFFGTYTLSDRTEPGWTVELYVNNTLVDYAKADASGFFTFQVPMAYGSTEVMLRFYGPNGEEKSRVIKMQVPFTFVPKNECEYTLTGGIIQDSTHAQFYRGSINYGLTRNITIGAGTEYLSSIKTGKNIPFVNTSFSLGGGLLFTGEYAFGVRAMGLLSYRLPSNLMLEVSYAKYEKDQKAVYYNYLEQIKANISLPIRFKKFSIYSRLSAYQTIYNEGIKNTTTELMLSAAFKRISANWQTYGTIISHRNPYIYSELSLGIRLPKSFTITPSVRYNHTDNAVTGIKCQVEKSIFKNGYFSISYQNYTDVNMTNLQVGFRYLFSFAQASVFTNYLNKQESISISMNGSLMFDPATSFVQASNTSKVGRGGITVLPFLDINCNGKRDKNEPKVSGLILKVTPGGRMEEDTKDTLIRIFDLEAYTNAFLELNIEGFDNIAWQLKKKIYSVAVDPNMMKLVEVPVSVVGEVAGRVEIMGSAGGRKQERIKLYLYRNDTVPVTWMYDDEGYYNYIGLIPGNFTLRPDTAQLNRLQLQSTPASRNITILPSREGTYLDGINFVLSPKKETGEQKPAPAVNTVAKEKAIETPAPSPAVPTKEAAPEPGAAPAGRPVPQTPKDAVAASAAASASTGETTYRVQLSAQPRQVNTEQIFAGLMKAAPGISITETLGNDKLYRCSAGLFKTRAEALEFQTKARGLGWKDCFLIKGK